MDEMYDLIKQKLQQMRDEKKDTIAFDYHEVSRMYQIVCFMKQIREIVSWGN